MVAGGDTARTRHVLDHDIGISGDVLAEVLGEDARVEIVTAARTGAEQERDVLALVEISDALLRWRRGCSERGSRQHSECACARAVEHDHSSPDGVCDDRFSLVLNASVS